MTQDHPRSRGVYLRTQFRHGRMRGSSPLARGLRGDAQDGGKNGGIIPARAGFTFGGAPFILCLRDHPRSRGVYGGDAQDGGKNGGIIPARAGFTIAVLIDGGFGEDHPRSRGVYSIDDLFTEGE